MLNSVLKLYPSKSAFCRAIGISLQFYSQIERGKRPWPPKTVLKLQQMHGVSPQDLRPDIFGHPCDKQEGES